MMDRGIVRNMQSFIPRIKFEKLVHLVGFIIRIYHDARSHERKKRVSMLCCYGAWVANYVYEIAFRTRGK